MNLKTIEYYAPFNLIHIVIILKILPVDLTMPQASLYVICGSFIGSVIVHKEYII